MINRPVLSAQFIDGSKEPLFVLSVTPGHCVPKACLLLLAPFAEEMNRSRKMMAAIGRTLAHRGFRVLIADTCGTGDSGGSFEEASWDEWVSDVAAIRLHARTASGDHPFWLGGIRTGALLAADSLHQTPSDISGALMIQPVISGERFLTQFLRLRVAAAMTRGDRESAGALKEQLENGENVMVSGYTLPPGLALQMAQRSLHRLAPPSHMPIEWIETGPVAREPDELLASIPTQWRNGSLGAHYQHDGAFWALSEPVAPKGLLDLIAQRMESHLP